MHKVEDGRIVADKGHVIKAYMIDINPFCAGGVRRVLIDHIGMVFVPTSGWSNYQGSYKIISLPNQVETAGRLGLYGFDDRHWWERPAWDDELWAWTHMQRGKLPIFSACYTIDMGDGTHAIFAH